MPAAFFAGEHTVRGGGILDGAKGTVSAFADVLADRMPMQGITRYERAGSTFTARWGGHCVNGKANGKVVTMCSGDWVMLPGATGSFAGIVLSGIWRGIVNAEGGFEGELEAMYTR